MRIARESRVSVFGRESAFDPKRTLSATYCYRVADRHTRQMSFTFFATNTDLFQLAVRFLDDPDLTLFEAASRPGQPNRWFGTVSELTPFFAETPYSFSIWAKSTGARPMPDFVSFNEGAQRGLGGKGRTVLESPTVISIHRNGDQRGCLASSQMNYWTEKGARQRAMSSNKLLDAIDWKAMRSVSGRIQRTVKKMSAAQLDAYPILPDAFRRLQLGEQPLWGWGDPVECTSPRISGR